MRVPLGTLDAGVWLGSPNPDPISDQNMSVIFQYPFFQTWSLKLKIAWEQVLSGLGGESLLIHIHTHFQIGFLESIPYPFCKIHNRLQRFSAKWLKSVPYVRLKRLKHHTPWYPPPPPPKWEAILFNITLHEPLRRHCCTGYCFEPMTVALLRDSSPSIFVPICSCFNS